MSIDLTRLLHYLIAAVRPECPSEPVEWPDDPLSHPDLRHMSPKQLADLPFERARATEQRLAYDAAFIRAGAQVGTQPLSPQ